eukprot:5498203-Prymnesium_polylepis.1
MASARCSGKTSAKVRAPMNTPGPQDPNSTKLPNHSQLTPMPTFIPISSSAAMPHADEMTRVVRGPSRSMHSPQPTMALSDAKKDRVERSV